VWIDPEFIGLPIVVNLGRGIYDDCFFLRDAFESVKNEEGI